MNTIITPSRKTDPLLNMPLGPLRALISRRARNLLINNGFTTVAEVREAQKNGLQPGDFKGLGPATLLEIRLALDNLPTEEPPPPGPDQDGTSSFNDVPAGEPDPELARLKLAALDAVVAYRRFLNGDDQLSIGHAMRALQNILEGLPASYPDPGHPEHPVLPAKPAAEIFYPDPVSPVSYPHPGTTGFRQAAITAIPPARVTPEPEDEWPAYSSPPPEPPGRMTTRATQVT